MLVDFYDNFMDNVKYFFEVHPTYFVIVMIAIFALVASIIAYIIICTVDFDNLGKNEKKERMYIRRVLHEGEEGLFSVNMNISFEKVAKRNVKKRRIEKVVEDKDLLPAKNVEEVTENNALNHINNSEKEVIESTNNIEENIKNEKSAKSKEKHTRTVFGKYEVFYDGQGYFYTLKASNGELLISSEHYTTKDTVFAAIETIKRNIEVGKISIMQDNRGLFQFYLTAKNHRTLVVSSNYPTEKRAIAASESFKRFAASSPVVEQIKEVESNKEEINIIATNKKGGKIGVVKVDNGFVYFLKASNGELLAQSDSYKTEDSALKALEKFKDAVRSGKFYLVKDKRGNYQFKLFSSAGRIIKIGETFSSKQQAIDNANSVCSFIELATMI